MDVVVIVFGEDFSGRSCEHYSVVEEHLMLVGCACVLNEIPQSSNEVNSIHLVKGIDLGQIENHLHIKGPPFIAGLRIKLFHSQVDVL